MPIAHKFNFIQTTNSRNFENTGTHLTYQVGLIVTLKTFMLKVRIRWIEFKALVQIPHKQEPEMLSLIFKALYRKHMQWWSWTSIKHQSHFAKLWTFLYESHDTKAFYVLQIPQCHMKVLNLAFIKWPKMKKEKQKWILSLNTVLCKVLRWTNPLLENPKVKSSLNQRYAQVLLTHVRFYQASWFQHLLSFIILQVSLKHSLIIFRSKH